MKYWIEIGQAEAHEVELDVAEIDFAERDAADGIERTDTGTGRFHVVADVDGRPYTLEIHEVEPGVYWFLDDGRSREGAVSTRPGGSVTVELDSRRLETRVLDRRARLERARRGGVEGTGRIEVRSPMPGRVVRILVEDGEVVQDAQPVVVIEAMKMQNEIRAPRPGTVRVRVSAGQTVNAGDVVLSVE